MKPFEKIYTVVSQIPLGKVATYQQIAEMAYIGNPRIVGFALHQNEDPQNVPCHRVVNKKGGLAKGYVFGGPKVQKAKLEKEGVIFLENGRVDLSKSLWEDFR